MMIIKNLLIPYKRFYAMNLFGIIFIRRDKIVSEEVHQRMMNHERIHSRQMIELLFVFFYIIYFFEWIYRLIFHTNTAYRGISFEREAYNNQTNPDYLKTRKCFAQWRKRK